MSRLVCALVLAMSVNAGPGIATVSASNDWCDTDPVVVIQTPSGNLVPVYVNVGTQSSAYTPNSLMSALQMDYTAAPVRSGSATRVDVSVMVPTLLDSPFPTRVVISTGPLGSGSVYSQVSGTSGQVMNATFILPDS